MLTAAPQAAGIYLHALRHWWWALLLVAAATVAAAAFFTARQDRVYRAAATVAVGPAAEIEGASDVMRSLETLERRTIIATFASVAEARATRDSAAALLDLAPRDLSGYRVRAAVVPSTNIIRVSVEGPDGERVARVANAVSAVLADRAREMYRIFALRPLEEAVAARSPLRPEPTRNLIIAAIVGVFAGMLVALALEFLRPAPRRVPGNGDGRSVAAGPSRRPAREPVGSEQP
ncbi:MAG TPA: hypothetical protein VMK65_04045 [Longimicrobiales bacterium]|nr:hypothetical protein [Longimicrobiales bacterium]